MISLSAEIATYYFNLRTFQRQLYVTKEHLSSQDRVVDIAKARFEAGLVSKLDVAQALTVYYSTEASIPQLETSIRQAINAIAILIGVYPEDISLQLEKRDRCLNTGNLFRWGYRQICSEDDQI